MITERKVKHVQKIKTIIFDLGGVVRNTDWDSIYADVAKRIGVEKNKIADYDKKNIRAMMHGEIGFDHFVAAMNIELDAKSARRIWVEEAVKHTVIDKKVITLIDNLRKNYCVVILSNLTESRTLTDMHIHLYDHFDKVFLSYKEKLCKPDERFFRLALLTTKTAPQGAIFVDDDIRNTDAAKKLGINVIAYADIEQLTDELKKLRVQL